jgi:hypothetical protein
MLEDPGTWFINCKEPLFLMGRWLGAAASVPTPVAKTTRPTGPGAPQGGPIAISRSGVGTLSVVLPSPFGVIQSYEFWVNSGTSATDKNVRTTPPTAGSGTFALQVTFTANGVAVDLAATDELCMFVVSSISANP